MTGKPLMAQDIERLENTSFAALQASIADVIDAQDTLAFCGTWPVIQCGATYSHHGTICPNGITDDYCISFECDTVSLCSLDCDTVSLCTMESLTCTQECEGGAQQ